VFRVVPAAAPATGQPAVFIGTNRMEGDWAPPILEELGLLRVYFDSKSKNPSATLIDCLHTIPGVQFAEEIPLWVMPRPETVTDPGAKVIQWSLDAIGHTEPPSGLTYPELAILDDDFDPPKGHGYCVKAIVADLLPDAATVAFPIAENGFLKRPESVTDPSLYYSALRDIRKNGKVKVVNISRSQPAPSRLEAQEFALLEGADVLVIAASGNMLSETTVQFPGGYPTVMAVGASDEQNAMWPESCYGLPGWAKCLVRKTYSVDVVAPGVLIGSTMWSGLLSGTSFAAPFVSALATLIRAQNGTLKNEAVRQRIRDASSAAPLSASGSVPAEAWGFGLINWPLAVAGQSAQ
jgi:subtilisin family serine protease